MKLLFMIIGAALIVFTDVALAYLIKRYRTKDIREESGNIQEVIRLLNAKLNIEDYNPKSNTPECISLVELMNSYAKDNYEIFKAHVYRDYYRNLQKNLDIHLMGTVASFYIKELNSAVRMPVSDFLRREIESCNNTIKKGKIKESSLPKNGLRNNVYMEFSSLFERVRDKLLVSLFGDVNGIIDDSYNLIIYDQFLILIRNKNVDIIYLNELVFQVVTLHNKKYIQIENFDSYKDLYIDVEKYSIDIDKFTNLAYLVKETPVYKLNKYEELLANGEYDKLTKLCNKELLVDENNYLLWYYSFLSKNKDYRMDSTDYVSEIEFNKALELAPIDIKDVLNSEYIFYKDILESKDFRDLFRDLDRKQFNDAINRAKDININRYGISIDHIYNKLDSYNSLFSLAIKNMLKDKVKDL